MGMEVQQVLARLEAAPVVAAVKDDEGLQKSLISGAGVVFVLYGSLLTLPQIVAQLHQAGKAAMVHLDLVEGLAAQDVSVDFVAWAAQADGILSTKPGLVKHAMSLGLVAIRRYFLLDSMALQNVTRQLQPGSAHMVEVLPGLMPKMIKKIAGNSPLPLIAGGLISDKEDVMAALSAGALAVSTTNPDVWAL